MAGVKRCAEVDRRNSPPEVPFTTKAELVADQAVNPPYGTNLTFPVSRYVRCHQTSGTTGAPLALARHARIMGDNGHRLGGSIPRRRC